MDHHPTLPPSAFPALIRCGKYQSGGGSEAADEGTKQHATLDRWLVNGEPDDTDKADVDTDAGLVWAFHKVRELLGTDYDCGQMLSVVNDHFETVTFGTADVSSKDGKILIDYKSGQHRDYKPQLAIYALGLMQKHGTKTVKCYELYGRSFAVVEYDIAYDEALVVLDAVLDSKAAGIAKPCDYCGFCANNGTCEAVLSRVNEVVAGRPDWALQQYHASALTDPKEIAKAIEIAKAVSVWAENVLDFAKKALEAGQDVPGWVLKKRAGARAIRDIEKAYNVAGLTPTEFLGACKVSLTELEKRFAAAKPDLKKGAAKKKLYELLGDNVAQGKEQSILSRQGEVDASPAA